MQALILVPEPDFPEESRWAVDVEAAALRDHGIGVETQSWSEPRELDRFDVVLPLVAWGYQLDPARWFRVIDHLEQRAKRVLNPPSVLRWNTDKNYLVELGEKGIATIPTRRVASLREADLRDAHREFGDDLVIKPPISGGAFGTHRLRLGDDIPIDEFGREMLIQPFLPAVQEEGEYSLLFFGGHFSHALVKRPRDGEYRVQPHLGGREEACDLPSGALEVAEAALAAAPAPCAYARVDLIRGADDNLMVIELELIEPALWLNLSPGAPSAFADAVRSASERPSE